MGDFKGLTAWQLSFDLTIAIYRQTTGFPPDERYGMASQLRRAAVSVGANIAEGSGRPSLRDQARFFYIALGSSREVEALLLIAGELSMIPEDQVAMLKEAVGRLQRTVRALAMSAQRRSSRE
jgi:four helix bundle protein